MIHMHRLRMDLRRRLHQIASIGRVITPGTWGEPTWPRKRFLCSMAGHR